MSTPAPSVRLRLPRIVAALGAGFLLLGLFLGLVDGFARALGPVQPAAAGVDPAPWLLLGAAAVAALGVFLVVVGILSRVRVDGAGTLTVRSLPPWRVRRVSLDALVSVAGRRGPIKKNVVHGDVQTTVLELRDAAGASLRLNPWFWAEPQPLLAALRAAAARSGAAVDERAARHLGDPGVGGRV